jgi:hypothetical protein
MAALAVVLGVIGASGVTAIPADNYRVLRSTDPKLTYDAAAARVTKAESATAGPAWMNIVFLAPARPDLIVLSRAWDLWYSPNYPVEFHLEVSEDGSRFTRLAANNGASQNGRIALAPAGSAERVPARSALRTLDLARRAFDWGGVCGGASSGLVALVRGPAHVFGGPVLQLGDKPSKWISIRLCGNDQRPTSADPALRTSGPTPQESETLLVFVQK